MSRLVTSVSLTMLIASGATSAVALAARAPSPFVAGSPSAAAATPAATSDQTPGAAKLGTTNYPIPAGAVFVAPSGKDNAAGSAAAPYASLAHAIAAAPNNGTIVLRAGIYRESDVIASKVLTIQPYPNEAVIVRGSNVVTGFVATGTTWTLNNWTYQFPRQNPRDVTGANPLANAPDQVFVDGAPLSQVGKAGAVAGRSFYVDYTAHQLVIGLNPAGHTIEASTKMMGLHLEHATGSVIRGIQFDEFATPANSHGAVLDSSGGATFENDIFCFNATAGLSVQGKGTLVTHDTFNDNGQLGLQGYQSDNIHVTYSEMRHNNTEGFDVHQEAGGMKLSSANDVLIDYNYFDGNLGKGMWMDVASLRSTIVRNEAYANQNEGIQFEISTGAVIAGNVSWRNAGGGIRVIEAQHVDIYNNVLYQNGDAINVWEGSRPQNVADVTIRNNIIIDGAAKSTEMLDVWDTTRKKTGAQMGVTTDADAFCRSTANKPAQVVAWANGAAGQARYASVAAFSKATGSDAHGIACDGAAAAKMATNAAAGDFSLPAGSPGVQAGVALPSNVANALDVSSGVPVDLGLLGPGVHHGPGPTITVQPVSTAVLVGQTYNLSAAASGTPRPTVQWQMSTDGVSFSNIAGATTNHLSGVAASTDNGKAFRAVFSNSGGVSTSDAATLTVGSIAVSVEDPGPKAWGEPFTIVADASISGVPSANVGGSVTFYDGSTKLGNRTVRAGVASMTAPKLDAGNHSLIAVYTVLRTTVTSDPTTVDVSPAATILDLRVSDKKATVGEPITLTGHAVVFTPSTGAIISGTISFYDEGILLESVPIVSGGRAQLVVSDFAAGTHDITATYDGDTNYQPSTETAPITITVQ
jgi:hypothetical protein